MSDYMVFDQPDEDEVVAAAAARNYLVVGPIATTSEDLNVQEEQYRKEGRPPVLFVEDDQLGNAVQIARAMGLPIGQVPTLEQAEAWSAAWAGR